MEGDPMQTRGRLSARVAVVATVISVLTTAALIAVTPGAARAAQSRCTDITYVGAWSAPTPYRADWHLPSIGAQTRNLECHLWRGHSGIAVKALQETLIDCYDQPIAADGLFGPRTQEAVRNAQRKINQEFGAGVGVDGSYGPQTRFWMKFAIYREAGGPQIWDHCLYPFL
jgi:hypothetical protein